MGESGGSSLTGARLHRFHQIGLRGQDDRWRCVEEAEDEGLRLQPGVRRQLLSANDPVHQPQGHLWTVLEEGRRLPSPQRRSHLCKVHQHAVHDKSSAKHNLDQFLIDAHKTQIKELNGTTAMARVNLMKNIVTSRRQPHTPTSKLIRDHYIKLVKNLALRD